MIRELTKSALSFSWAMSLLGLKQVVNLGRGAQQSGGGDLFSPVTQVAAGQLDESMKGIYRSAESIGARAVDLAFSMMNPMNWLNPSAWKNMPNMGNAAEWMNPNTWMRTVTNITQAAGGGCCGNNAATGRPASGPAAGSSAAPNAPVDNSSAAVGWGPMPGDA